MNAQELAELALNGAGNDMSQGRAILREAAKLLPAQPFGQPRPFLIRILISRGESAEADTDPELEIDARPTWEVLGMAAISRAVASTVAAFHTGRHDLPPDLTVEALDARLPSLRVTLTRGKGSTWWRVPYHVGAVRWIAAVHVVRAERP
jgi:hypothetical protein